MKLASWLKPLALAPALIGASGATAPGGTRWYDVTAGSGARVGYASEEVLATPNGRDTISSRELLLQEGDQPTIRLTTRTIVHEAKDGSVVAVSELSQTGASWVRTDATIRGGFADITRQTGQSQRKATIPLPPGIRFDDGEGLLAAWDPTKTPKLEFDNFNIGDMVVERIVLEAAAAAEGDERSARAVIRKRYDGSMLRAIARLLVAPDGHILSLSQPMFGTSLVTRATDQAEALRPHPPYSMLTGTTVKSPYRILPDALAGHIRYRFSFPAEFAIALPQTGEQAVTADGGGATVDVCAGCGPGLSTDSAYLADARRPTAWMESDDPQLRAIAAPIARLHVPQAQKMELLLYRARPYLQTIDFAGHYSAVETLSRKKGDCTEAAVLLAALGRAAGIATRVASGLAYSRERYHGVSNVFMPHSWTLAYVDGAWRSFDLALDTFDASHIAVTIGDGDPRQLAAASQLASLLQWQAMTEVRRRKAG